MLMLTLEDAVRVTVDLLEYYDVQVEDSDVDYIEQELEQKCYVGIPDKNKSFAEELDGYIMDINPAEIASQIESDHLRNWCKNLQVAMHMAMIQGMTFPENRGNE